MKAKTKWIIALIFFAIAYSVALVLTWQSVYRPYERPPVPTKAEIKRVHKQHGYFTLISTQKGTYFKRKGQIVWIARR